MQRKHFSLFILFTVLNHIAGAQTIRERVQERRANKVEKEQDKSVGPDYSDLYFWAAHPWKKDMSDSIPGFLGNETRDSLADVFYMHPTTFTKDMFNADYNAD